MTTVFIDGREGTTGLGIFERIEKRKDLTLLAISDELRKDPAERKRLINASDIVFLCLPDAAARESVAMIENEHVRVLDTSTAHRTAPNWQYGFPELSPAHRAMIASGKRVAVPGCHASGFNALVYPLVKAGVLPDDFPITCQSVTGYSGGGKKMIAQYADMARGELFLAPRQYALSQSHKHLPEMTAVCGLKHDPVFIPVVADYYSGMLVTVPIHARALTKRLSPSDIYGALLAHYAGCKVVNVLPLGAEAAEEGYLSANAMRGRDDMQILVTGNQDRILVHARFDNLGKGASGAALQCLNIMLGMDETLGLEI